MMDRNKETIEEFNFLKTFEEFIETNFDSIKVMLETYK